MRSRKQRTKRYLSRVEKLPIEEQRKHLSLLLAWFVRVLPTARVAAESARGREKRL